MSCLILRAYLKTTYRGVLDHLKKLSGLAPGIGLGGQTAALQHPAKVQRPQSGVGNSGQTDSEHRSGSGRGGSGRRDGRDGCNRFGV